MKETTIAERKIILNLFEQEKSYSRMGKMINRNRFTVRSVITRFLGEKDLINATRGGRSRKLIDQE